MNNGYCLKLVYYNESDEILFFRNLENAQKYIRNRLMEDVIKHIQHFAYDIDYYQIIPLEELFEIIDNQSERLMFPKLSPDEYSIIEIKFDDFPDSSSLLKRLIGR